MLIPLLPISLLWAFQYDLFYGNLPLRAQKTAAALIAHEPERFNLPAGSGIVRDQAHYDEIMGHKKR